jgi:hypothetical protein
MCLSVSAARSPTRVNQCFAAVSNALYGEEMRFRIAHHRYQELPLAEELDNRQQCRIWLNGSEGAWYNGPRSGISSPERLPMAI